MRIISKTVILLFSLSLLLWPAYGDESNNDDSKYYKLLDQSIEITDAEGRSSLKLKNGNSRLELVLLPGSEDGKFANGKDTIKLKERIYDPQKDANEPVKIQLDSNGTGRSDVILAPQDDIIPLIIYSVKLVDAGDYTLDNNSQKLAVNSRGFYPSSHLKLNKSYRHSWEWLTAFAGLAVLLLCGKVNADSIQDCKFKRLKKLAEAHNSSTPLSALRAKAKKFATCFFITFTIISVLGVLGAIIWTMPHTHYIPYLGLIIYLILPLILIALTTSITKKLVKNSR